LDEQSIDNAIDLTQEPDAGAITQEDQLVDTAEEPFAEEASLENSTGNVQDETVSATQLEANSNQATRTIDIEVVKTLFNIVSDGNQIEADVKLYSGSVDYLEYQLFGDVQDDVVTGSIFNDFLNLLGGDDAADGGDGQDIIDGGTGSNFLTGGRDADTFYIDGRGAAPDAPSTWSTVTDFNAADGDTVNIWGWVEGTSQLLSTKLEGENGSGATGFEGFTHHYDLDGDGTIDTSITFTGLAAVPATSEARQIESLVYQYYGA